jgi:aminoglycoside phosphotransferase (APT) family kinase protein
MNQQTFTQRLNDYLKQSMSLINPKINLDWVNTEGWESEIYAYTLTHGEPGARLTKSGVLRLLTGADFANAQSEFRMLSLLHKAGYPVPEVYELGSPNDGFKHPFILMQRVEGGDFSSRFPKTPKDNLKPLRDFIDLFRRLHTLDWRPFIENPDQVSPPNQPYYHFDRKLDLFSHYLERAGLKALDPVIVWLSAQREKATCDRASVVHQDFHPNNILEDVNGNLFVVDWTSAEISDYRFDLAWTLTLTLAYGGNTSREMVLAEYERQMGIEVPRLELFEVIAYVRRIGSSMISMQNGAENLGMRPEAVVAMKQDRIAYERLYQQLTTITNLPLPEISAWVDSLG